MMPTFSDFAEHYPRLRRWVASVQVPGGLDDPGGNTDFFVTLRDGSTFSFVAFTPENMRFLIDRDGDKSFLAPGMIVVSAITLDCLLDAIERWLPRDEHGDGLLEHFGVLQSDDDDWDE